MQPEPGSKAEAPAGLFAPLFGPPRRLYAWILSWAQSPYGPLALFVLSFCESSFFPIPPDPLLIALCLGARQRSIQFALLCTAASVLGGLAGYFIGQFAFDAAAAPILAAYGKLDQFDELAARFREAGGPAVLIAAITPVPYKLVTIASGATQVSLPVFIGASIVGRGARFGALAALIAWKGEAIAAFIERWFEVLSVVFAVLLVGGFLLVRYAL